jgi:hypothetical protein
MGYVVARVEVDGRAVSLSAPAKLLHQLWSTTSAGDHRSATPLVDLYLEAISAGRPAPSIAPRGIDRIRQNYEVVATIRRAGHIDKHAVTLEGLLSSSEEMTAAQAKREFLAESNVYFWECSPRPMIGSRVEDRPFDFVEVLAGHATIARLAGYKGLVVTVDEFEVEQTQTRFQTRLQHSRVQELLGILTKYFAGNLDYAPAPLAMFFATVGADDHEGDNAISAMVGDSPDGHHYLEPWSAHQRAELAERIHGVYCDAYGLSADFDIQPIQRVEEQLRRFGDADSGLVRAFIKRYVALLDVAYGPPAA